MKDYTFKVPQDIVFGMGSLKRLPELLEKCGSKKMMIISDHGLEKLGVVEKIQEIVELRLAHSWIFYRIQRLIWWMRQRRYIKSLERPVL